MITFNTEKAAKHIYERRQDVQHTDDFCKVIITKDLPKSDRRKQHKTSNEINEASNRKLQQQQQQILQQLRQELSQDLLQELRRQLTGAAAEGTAEAAVTATEEGGPVHSVPGEGKYYFRSFLVFQ